MTVRLFLGDFCVYRSLKEKSFADVIPFILGQKKDFFEAQETFEDDLSLERCGGYFSREIAYLLMMYEWLVPTLSERFWTSDVLAFHAFFFFFQSLQRKAILRP